MASIEDKIAIHERAISDINDRLETYNARLAVINARLAVISATAALPTSPTAEEPLTEAQEREIAELLGQALFGPGAAVRGPF